MVGGETAVEKNDVYKYTAHCKQIDYKCVIVNTTTHLVVGTTALFSQRNLSKI